MIAVRLTPKTSRSPRSGNPLADVYVTGDALFADPPPPPPEVAWCVDEGGAILTSRRRSCSMASRASGSPCSVSAPASIAFTGKTGGVPRLRSLAPNVPRARSRNPRRTGERSLDVESAYSDYRSMAGERFGPADTPLPEGCGLVVVDSLSQAMGALGLDENSAQNFGRSRPMFWTRSLLRALDAVILVVDHPAERRQSSRGSSANAPTSTRS